MRVRFLIIFFLAFLFFNSAYAQKENADYVLQIGKISEVVLIDGELNEDFWSKINVADNFFMILPMDTSFAKVRTEVRMAYDDQNIYMSAVCFDDLPGGYVVESLRRDFSFGNNDNFLVFIDPFDDRTNGFTFGANAAGAQWDGLMYDGGSAALTWDNKWASSVKNYDDKWIFEASIPFKSIRYKKGIDQWGINFSRLDLKLNEKSSWAPVPRQFPSASLAYTGILQWDNPPPDPGTNISVIPYVMGGSSWDYETPTADGSPVRDQELDAGVDAKFSITPSLNLDLTVNPDFSQVEVDRQVTNLSRFELFFPERRQFFLENSDLFANFGWNQARPFFSRRIGLDSPIRFGARLSGKLNKDWRIGAMDIQTGKVDENGIPSQNYAVAAIQRQVFSRSNISGIFINRESMDFVPEKYDSSFTKYNRNVGLEYNLASADNLWKGKAIVHKSFSPELEGDDYMHVGNLTYKSKEFNVGWTHQYIGNNYNSEVGYIPRKGIIMMKPDFGYNFFPTSNKINSHGPKLSSVVYFDKDFEVMDSENLILYQVNMLDRSSFTIGVGDTYVKLQQPFDPTNSGGDTLAAGTSYRWLDMGIGYSSTKKNLLTYEIMVMGGEYYNGERLFIQGGVGYRFQPFGSISVDFSYNDIKLPEPYKSASFWLISPRIDLTLTNTLFITTFIQYNEQVENININARFQWRYKPASDIFIVYTDNYLPENMSVKTRALVFKVTYWWNI